MLFSDFSLLYNEILDKNSLSQYKTEALCQKFYDFYNLIVEFNSHTNITAITDAKEVILKHFADCMHVAKLIPEGQCKLIDIGCGGGFPSLPIAIVRPDVQITSLDSTAKKVEYVRKSAENLNLHNISTISGRAEELAHGQDTRETFDVVTARAVANLPVLCELCLPFVKKGGAFVAMKANISEDEIKDSESAIKKLGGDLENIEINRFELVLHDGSCEQRTILAIKKVAPTPTDLPRHYSKIKSKRL